MGTSSRTAVAAFVGLSIGLAGPGFCLAQEGLSQQEALRVAFPPPAVIERRTAFLDEAGLATYYVGLGPDGPLGVAWFDAHRVRTLPEVLMIVVTPAGEVGRVELLRFAEPPEYAPPRGWLDRFEGLAAGADFDGEPVTGMTGATLTSRAVTDAVRRVLALHELVQPFTTDSVARPASPRTAASGS